MGSRQVTIQGVMTWEDAGAPVFPTHPIAPGGPPLGIWGGAPLPTPTPPIYYPPGVNVPVFPTHPIAPGGPPLGIWGGAPLPVPTPPIYYPPSGGGQPPYPSTGPGFPTHPIAPGGPPPEVGWTPPGTLPSHPISGGGYVIGWHPYFGYVVIPIGGAPPPSSGGAPPEVSHPIAPGGEPTHPIAEP
jgi:hypothetical protein